MQHSRTLASVEPPSVLRITYVQPQPTRRNPDPCKATRHIKHFPQITFPMYSPAPKKLPYNNRQLLNATFAHPHVRRTSSRPALHPTPMDIHPPPPGSIHVRSKQPVKKKPSPQNARPNIPARNTHPTTVIIECNIRAPSRPSSIIPSSVTHRSSLHPPG